MTADAREKLAKTVFSMDRRGLHVNRLWSELDGRQRAPYLRTADALLPLIAAEVEARVQAAADQRAVEVRCTRGHLESEHWQDGRYSCPAALASPAPAHVHGAVATRHGHPGVCCCLTQNCRATDCGLNAAKVTAALTPGADTAGATA